MCYLTKYSRFKSNSLGVGRGSKNFRHTIKRPLKSGAWLTPRNTLFYHLCYILRQNWSFWVKPHERRYRRFARNVGPSRPAFQGHWNRTDRSAIYDFLLAIHSSHGPFIVSEINGDFGQMVERVWRYVHSFRYNTRVWRTDGRTDLP